MRTECILRGEIKEKREEIKKKREDRKTVRRKRGLLWKGKIKIERKRERGRE